MVRRIAHTAVSKDLLECCMAPKVGLIADVSNPFDVVADMRMHSCRDMDVLIINGEVHTIRW
jgi:hypothetical protein